MTSVRRTVLSCLATVAFAVATAGVLRVSAQRPVEPTVPFRVGETLTFDVSWSSFLTAGTAVATVKEKQPSFNSTAYYIVAEGRPTPLVAALYPVYYKLDTLLDSYTLLPQRATAYTEERRKHRLKTTRFDRPARRVFFEYQTDTTVKSEFATSQATLDTLSALYMLRTLPLKAGERRTVPVTDSGINYRMEVEATAPAPIATPLGALSASKIKLSVFDQGNKAVGKNVAVWLSNDARRLPLKLQAELPVGTFDLILRSVQ
jgi:hypothetical protein